MKRTYIVRLATAVPQGAGPHPAVILIHEWNGLVERVKEIRVRSGRMDGSHGLLQAEA